MAFERLGDRAIRFARPQGASPRAIVQAAHGWPGVVDVVVAREDIAVYFADEPVIDETRIAALAHARDDGTPVRDHVLRVVYDGPDLDEVARATGLFVAEVIAKHEAATYVVDTMGFAPGFAYLDGLDPALELPRRATPRERVPAGSVAVAGRQSAVYPADSPGGWHLLGRVVDAQMYTAADGPLLALGDRVRFVRA
jgi:KipI family sensor histidine kinase inhibitor